MEISIPSREQHVSVSATGNPVPPTVTPRPTCIVDPETCSKEGFSVFAGPYDSIQLSPLKVLPSFVRAFSHYPTRYGVSQSSHSSWRPGHSSMVAIWRAPSGVQPGMYTVCPKRDSPSRLPLAQGLTQRRRGSATQTQSQKL